MDGLLGGLAQRVEERLLVSCSVRQLQLATLGRSRIAVLDRIEGIYRIRTHDMIGHIY